MKRQTVAVGLVHVRLNFEHKRGKVRAERVDHAAVGFARQRARRHAQKFFQKRLHAKVRQRRAKEHRRKRPARTSSKIKLPACTEQFYIVDQLLVAAFADELRDLRVVRSISILSARFLPDTPEKKISWLERRSYTP